MTHQKRLIREFAGRTICKTEITLNMMLEEMNSDIKHAKSAKDTAESMGNLDMRSFWTGVESTLDLYKKQYVIPLLKKERKE